MSEIKNGISEFKDGNSPGIDGFPLEFYKHLWGDLKEILLELYTHILNHGNMMKTSAVCFIPKGNDKTKLENWRPISLFCVDYKIIAKLLTNRLKPSLNRFINPYQTRWT